MLLFRYIKPDADIVKTNCKKKEIKTIKECIEDRKSISSHDGRKEWTSLFNQICLMKGIIAGAKKKMMYEDFLPQSLKPYQIEPWPASYVECCAFIDILKVYYDYINENKVDIVSKNDRIKKLLQTVIIVEDDLVKVLSSDCFLKKLTKQKMKEYKQYHIHYAEE